MTRDVGWDVIAQFQFIIVQLISINANYTAARARPADPIKVQGASYKQKNGDIA